jgi:hypothetical protein
MRPYRLLAAAVPVLAAILIAAYTEPPIPRLPVRKLAGSIQYRPVLNSEGVFADLPVGKRIPPPPGGTRASDHCVFLGEERLRPERVTPEIATSEATAARPPRNARPGSCEATPVPRTYESMLSDVPKNKRKRWRVEAQYVVDTAGRITCIYFTQLTPDDRVNRGAMDFVLGWKQRPLVCDGKNVEYSSIADVGFHPKD